MMTPDELAAHRRAEAVKAAAVVHDHVPAVPPPVESLEAAGARRMAELHAANRVGEIPAQPGDLENIRVNSTVTANEGRIGSLDNLNTYLRDKLGYNANGFKPWKAHK